MDFKLEVDPKSIDEIEKMKKSIDKGLLKGMRKAMYFIEAESKRRFGTSGNLKVQSGRLRSSIKTNIKETKEGMIGSIGSNVIYASIHELGTSRIPARPFILPAINDNVDDINRLISESITKEVNR